MSIVNYGAALPKKFQAKGRSQEFNEKLKMKTLFRGVILAPSNAGKTNLALHIIKNSPNIYTHLHLVARNPDQPIYHYLKEALEGHITVYEAGTIPSVDQIKDNGAQQLVLIDDYSSDKRLVRDMVSPYFIRGRHKGLSTLFLSHSWFALDKLVRLNSEYLWILKANSARDMRLIVSDFTLEGVTIEKLMQAYQIATKEKGQCLMLDSVNGQLRLNFDKVINVDEL
jgi:hypothetical protein